MLGSFDQDGDGHLGRGELGGMIAHFSDQRMVEPEVEELFIQSLSNC